MTVLYPNRGFNEVYKNMGGKQWNQLQKKVESATILAPPSTGLIGILLSLRNQYSRMTRIWKNINTISMYGEKIYQLHIETTTTVATS